MTARLTVITGGTKGIGLAVAHALARQGHALRPAFRSDEDAADVARVELSRYGSAVETGRCDVADDAAVRDLFEHADTMGPLGALVNGGGYAERQSPFEGIGAGRWTRVLATNVIGTASCCREPSSA